MPPKTKFTKEQIVEAAFDIAANEGIDQISIRKVASKLGSSIAPIYVNFTEVEQLKKEVLLKIRRLSQQMLLNAYDPDPFLNIGIASLKFARQYPVLFRDLVMNHSRYVEEVQPDLSEFIKQMRQSSSFSGFTHEELMEVMLKMQIFQLGLSMMDVNGMLPNRLEEAQLIGLLKSAGEDLITAMHIRKQSKEK